MSGNQLIFFLIYQSGSLRFWKVSKNVIQLLGKDPWDAVVVWLVVTAG